MSRRKKRKRQNWVPLAVVIAVLALALWLLLANFVFVVRDVQVVGAGEIPEADVRHLSGIRLGYLCAGEGTIRALEARMLPWSLSSPAAHSSL